MNGKTTEIFILKKHEPRSIFCFNHQAIITKEVINELIIVVVIAES